MVFVERVLPLQYTVVNRILSTRYVKLILAVTNVKECKAEVCYISFAWATYSMAFHQTKPERMCF